MIVLLANSSSTSAVYSVNHLVQCMNSPGLADHLPNKDNPKIHNQSSFFSFFFFNLEWGHLPGVCFLSGLEDAEEDLEMER